MNFDKLRDLMNHFVEANHAPGNTVSVYLDQKKVFEYSCGYADVEKRLPMTGKEHFYLYSCSKIATVTAALQLLERGEFLLTDPLYEYIPEFRQMYVKGEDGTLTAATKSIRILDLFNMTAGLSYNIKSEGLALARARTGGKMDTLTVAKCIASDPLSFEPGERFQYSLCHDVLAGLVCAVTGKKFRDYVKENIFDPLGMKDSVYHLTPEIEKNLAMQYEFVEEGGEKEKNLVDAQKYGNGKQGNFIEVGPRNHHIFGEEYDSGGAGIISTAADYAKLAAALANFGKGINGERILSPATVELMRTNTLNERQIRSFNWPQLCGYGYGLGVRTMMDRTAGGSLSNIGEFGWGGAAGASVYIDPKIGLCAVYLKHTLNPREGYYQPRVRNVLYSCLEL